MTLVRDVRLLFWRKMRETLRQPVWIVSGLSTPLLYLALFDPLLKGLHSPLFGGVHGNSVMNVFVPGILALMAFGSGMGAGWTVIWELQSGVIERFRVTPTRRFSLLMGPVLRDTVMFVIPAALVLFVAHFFGFDLHWLGLIILFILYCMLTAVVSAISGSLGLVLQDIGSLAAAVTGLQLPLTLLAGVLLPLSIGPNWLKVIAHFNPMYYVVNASRVLAAGSIQNAQVWQAFLVMFPLLVVVLWWATRVYGKVVA